MNKSKTLYKRNTNGKVLQWNIIVDGNKYWAEYGQVGGKIQADTPTICEGKNIGRSNETSPDEQAKLEFESKYKKQIEIKGYCEDINKIDEIVFTPMLAHSYDKHGEKLPERVIVSPKMDGVRCYITKDGAFSRNGKKWVATKFIEEGLAPVFEKYPNLILDGELYCHRYSQDFNKIVSLAKKTKHISDVDWDEIKLKLEYHVFDCMITTSPSLSYELRMSFIKNLDLLKFGHNLVMVESVETTKTDFHEHFQRYMECGYEGIMLRDPESAYECKRSYGLQKYKEFVDAEFKIVDIEEGVGNRSGMFGRMILEHEGNTFEANSRGNQEYYTDLWKNKNKYIGKMATIRYQNLTPDGIPRFGVCITIRDYE